MGANKVPQPVRVEMSQAWQLGGCAPRTAGGLERTPHHALRLGLWWEARAARRGRAIVQISKPSPGASWCPPPCPELPPRGWQMLFHRLGRVGGLRKVLLGGSGGQWGCRQLPPSQSGLTVASQVPQYPRLGGRGWHFGIETGAPCLRSPPYPPPTAHQASWLWPPPIPGCVCRAPRGRQGRRRSGLRTAGARAAKYLRELSETDRHVGNLVRVGLGEAAGWAGRQEEGRWGCLPRLLNPAETTILPSPNQKVHLAPSSCLYQYSETVTLAGV